jgi:drug/metabolite transporter (DMT)-like permease
VIRVAAPGGLLLAADMMLFFSSVKLTSVAVATVISALQPALVMLMAGRLLGERVDRRNIAWTALAIAGVAIIVLGGGTPDHHERLGDLLAVGSLLAWAGYFVAAKSAQPRIDALDYTAGVTIVAASAASVVVLVSRTTFRVTHGGDWLWICLLAVVPTGAHLMMNWAHRYLDASISSVIGSANPIVAAVAAYLVLGQGLDALQIAGGVVGILAISVVAARRGHAPASPVK